MPNARSRRPGRPPLVEVDEPTADKILRTAAQCFMEDGFAAVSMDQVAARAGVTKAVVYYYYRSKTALFHQAMLYVMRVSRERTQAILREPGPLYDRLLKLARTRLRIEATLDMNHIMRGSQAVLQVEQQRELRQAEENLIRDIANALQTEMDEGRLRPLDPAFAARAYLAALAMAQLEIERRGGGEDAIESVAAELVDLLWRGMEPR
ncbi:TetR/AcrR family transcriptional regulator [Alicyclobacillus vulcanalis]|uniref:Transcriptional regulator, TetR family n=1 Tax=Alicyclobacillus vulcanalis TaxID=252246 RepID=A0A1N7MEJ4_9BACL|nr:TetR/AcrR family transcriptional regulator [Alicyclobacillus vulcanalis]SIS84421.1 transcriptional regulator, TetR family [Alicyclobacillus vulcanalis]